MKILSLTWICTVDAAATVPQTDVEVGSTMTDAMIGLSRSVACAYARLADNKAIE